MTEERNLTCAKCGQPCTEVEVEEGTPYEHFGTRGVHYVSYIVSDCCEAEINESDDEEGKADRRERQ